MAPVARFLGTHTHTESVGALSSDKLTGGQARLAQSHERNPPIWIMEPAPPQFGCTMLAKTAGTLFRTARIKWILSSGHSVVLDKIDYLYNLDFLGGMIPRQ